MSRTIGIRHRVKRTKAGDARPTQVCIVEGGKAKLLDLEDEQAELDFAFGNFPTTYRRVAEGEDVVGIKKRHHIKWRKLDSARDADGLPEANVRQDGRTYYRAYQVPSAYDGLQVGDQVAMTLGGSGDSFAYALTRRGRDIGASVHRIPPSRLNNERGSGSKDDDASLLAKLVQASPGLFYMADNRDMRLIEVRERYRARMDAMKARIAAEQRLRQSIVGEIFRSELYPEGDIEHAFDARKANDVVLQNLDREEATRERELTKSLDILNLYQQLFKPVDGVGPMAAARLLAAIVDYRQFIVEPDEAEMQSLYTRSDELEKRGNFEADIKHVQERATSTTTKFQMLQMVRSYKRRIGKEQEAKLLDEAIECHRKRAQMRRKARKNTASKLKKFCGVHVLPDGSFARKRQGQVFNSNPDARQGLFLLADQWSIYRPNSPWGQYLNLSKKRLRQTHPEELQVESADKKSKKKTVSRYSTGHIFKMARWRTLSRFVEQMAYAFCDFDKGKRIDGIRPPNSTSEVTEKAV